MTDAAGPAGTTADPVLEPRDGVGTPDRFRRLWTPHRLAYITSADGDAFSRRRTQSTSAATAASTGTPLR